jgi:predicted nucleotide-binding protein
MDFRTRLPDIRTVAAYLAPRTESDADALLASAGARGATPEGWGSWDRGRKFDAVLMLLTRQDDDVIDRLLILAGRTDLLPSAPAPAPVNSGNSAVSDRPAARQDGPIFLVHGHDHAKLHEAVRVLERATGRDVIVLHEQTNAGRTILEKFEDHAATASYAVVLLTADDYGGPAGATAQARARQNVIFELGFFFGLLGRGRVAVLLDQGVEQPSDIDGLVYIGLDLAGAWKQALARELEAVGMPIDYSRIP